MKDVISICNGIQAYWDAQVKPSSRCTCTEDSQCNRCEIALRSKPEFYVPRNKEIVDLRHAGWSFSMIAEYMKISHQRAHQIYKQMEKKNVER